MRTEVEVVKVMGGGPATRRTYETDQTKTEAEQVALDLAEEEDQEAEAAEDDLAWAPLTVREQVALARGWLSTAANRDGPPAALLALVDPESRQWLQDLHQDRHRLARVARGILESEIRGLRWIRRLRQLFSL